MLKININEVLAYYLLGFTSCVTPILFPWVNVIMKDDSEARAFTSGAMVCVRKCRDVLTKLILLFQMTLGWVFFSFWPITLFPVLEGQCVRTLHSVVI